MITPLSDTVRAQIRSSVEITALGDAVEQLLCNALDADATNVRIEVDFKKGFCSVVDNGCGIPAQEFGEDGNLARPYCTSNGRRKAQYGKNGQSLACLSALALITITSRTLNGPAHSLLLHQSKRISNGRAAEEHAEDVKPTGTKVVVHNLFGNFPVRFKAHAARSSTPAALERQFLHLKSRLVGYVLSFPNNVDLRLSVRDSRLKYQHRAASGGSRHIPFSAKVVHSVVKQAGLVSAANAESWRVASAKASGLSIRAAISMVPSPSKDCQFMSLACRPIQRAGPAAFLYDKVNGIFELSGFGAAYENDDLALASTRSRLRDGYAKGVDRWPCFYIRIYTQSNELDAALTSLNEAENLGNNALQNAVDLLATLIEHVLRSEQLWPTRTEIKREKRVSKPLQEHTPASASRPNFSDWTRARAAYPAVVEDMCEGLPFVARKDIPHQDVPIDPDVQILLDDMRLDSRSATPSRVLTPTDQPLEPGRDPPPPSPAACDDCVLWQNPRTGNAVRLNSNGFAVPPPATAAEEVSSDTGNGTEKRPMPGQRLARKGPSVKDIVNRLHQWPSHTYASPPEAALPSVAMDFEATAAAPGHSAQFTEQKISASDLAHAHVLGQVDQKFILALVPSQNSGDNLVLIDQHAADERIKVEELYRELCSVAAVALARPLILESGEEEEVRRLDQMQTYFASWGIRYELACKTIRVTHLPNLIAERCRQEPRLLIELLRKEVWADRRRGVTGSWSTNLSWLDRVTHCPAGLTEMVNSRACRSAIMFNDVLETDQCAGLVQRLARCTLPFQCAHGRPSLVVLTSLGYVGIQAGQEGSQMGFAAAFKRWS